MLFQALGYTGQGLVWETKGLPGHLPELARQHGFRLLPAGSAPSAACRRPVWPVGLHCCSLTGSDSTPVLLTQALGCS